MEHKQDKLYTPPEVIYYNKGDCESRQDSKNIEGLNFLLCEPAGPVIVPPGFIQGNNPVNFYQIFSHTTLDII